MNYNQALHILNLKVDATENEIKSAYRKLAMKYHPDKENGDKDKFQEILSAYQLLINKENDFNELNDIFDMNNTFFSSYSYYNNNFNSSYGFSAKGQDIYITLHISLEEGFYGVSKNINVGVKSVKIDIKSGVKSGQKLRLKGYGQRGMTSDLNGDLIIIINIINNENFILDDYGLHTIKEINLYDAILGGIDSLLIFNNEIKFKIPPSVQNNAILRIKNKGYPIYNTNEYGDLYIKVIIKLPLNLSKEELQLFKKLKELSNL